MGLAETAKLTAELNLKGDFNKNLGTAQKNLTGFSGKLKGLGGQAKQSVLTGFGMGGGFAAFSLFSVGVSKAIDVVGDAISKASDLEESQSKVNQVFTDSSDIIHDWASGAARDFGLSTAAAEEAAGTFGNFIQALGNTEDEANTMSRSLVELAADLASFNNTGIDETIIALRSGLAGEAEPMRRLGVSLSAARVEAYILAQGMAKTKGAITDAMKVSARYALIMEDTVRAQGDFDRTSDGLANTQRILAAEMDDALAKLGTVLLPVVTDAMQALTDVLPDVISGLEDVGETAAGIIGPLNDLKGGIDDLVDVVPEDVRDQFDFLFGTGGPVLGTAFRGLEVGQDILQGVGNDLGILHDEAAASYDPLSSIAVNMEHIGTAADGLGGAADPIKEVAEAADWASARIKTLGDALSEVASTGFGDVKSAAQSTQQAIKEAAKSNTWAALAKERDKLQRQRSKSGFQQGDVQAVIAQRLADIETQISQRRQVSRTFRGEGNTNGITLDQAAQAANNDTLANAIALKLQENATAAREAITTAGTEQATALGTMSTAQTAALSTVGTQTSTGLAMNSVSTIAGLSTVAASIAAIPPPPAPIVDVNVINNVSATTVEQNVQKVVRTNRTREDT